MRRGAKLLPAFAVLVALCVCERSAQAQDLEAVRRRTVRVEAVSGDSVCSHGSGVLLGIRDGVGYVMTARHVLHGDAENPCPAGASTRIVRNGVSTAASVVTTSAGPDDLAFLSFAHGVAGITPLAGTQIESLSRGDVVHVAGFPSTVFRHPATPEYFDSTRDSGAIALMEGAGGTYRGYSGGGAYDAQWRLWGMVFFQEAEEVRVYPLGVIRAAAATANIPFDVVMQCDVRIAARSQDGASLDAAVFDGGTLLGRTSAAVTVASGAMRRVTVGAQGYESQTVNLGCDSRAVAVVLVPLPDGGMPCVTRLESTPPGAHVEIDGRDFGTTPVDVRGAPGVLRHFVLRADDYEVDEGDFSCDEQPVVRRRLRRGVCSIYVRVSPRDAAVTVDGRVFPHSGEIDMTLTRGEVHRLHVARDGYVEQTLALDCDRGERLDAIELEPRTTDISIGYNGPVCGGDVSIRFRRRGAVWSSRQRFMGNPAVIRGVPLGELEYEVGGAIQCPGIGQCRGSGAGRITISDGGTYQFVWSVPPYGGPFCEFQVQ